uniref:Enhancer of polycomb-like protein n=1 Tax=Ascaris suum TaxID=6253 RepID=F1KR20_ASCSU
MATTSKLSFRARNLDASKSMPVYVVDELPDLAECAPINRAVAQMPTGMEKDEEMESHLQEAIIAQQASTSGIAVENHVIPTPKVMLVESTHYDSIYPIQPTPFRNQFIKVQASLTIDREQPEYDVDSEDEQWLSERGHLSADNFERMMELLEGASSDVQICQPKEARSLLKDFEDDLIDDVYDYWLQKRKDAAATRNIASLIPRVKTDNRRDAPGAVNPYVAFRRRAEKIQTRRNRKNDEDSYEKMFKLAYDIGKALILFDMVRKREQGKSELLALDEAIFDARWALGDSGSHYYNQLLAKMKPDSVAANIADESQDETSSSAAISVKSKSSHKKKKHSRNSAVASTDKDVLNRSWLRKITEAWNRPPVLMSTLSGGCSQRVSSLVDTERNAAAAEAAVDGRYAFKRRRGCVYRDVLPSSTSAGNITTTEELEARLRGHTPSLLRASASHANTQTSAVSKDPSLRFYKTFLPSSTNKGVRRCIGYARRRVGRGGRIIFDRFLCSPPSTSQRAPDDMPHPYTDMARTYEGRVVDDGSEDDTWSVDSEEERMEKERVEEQYVRRDELFRLRIFDGASEAVTQRLQTGAYVDPFEYVDHHWTTPGGSSSQRFILEPGGGNFRTTLLLKDNGGAVNGFHPCNIASGTYENTAMNEGGRVVAPMGNMQVSSTSFMSSPSVLANGASISQTTSATPNGILVMPSPAITAGGTAVVQHQEKRIADASLRIGMISTSSTSTEHQQQQHEGLPIFYPHLPPPETNPIIGLEEAGGQHQHVAHSADQGNCMLGRTASLRIPFRQTPSKRLNSSDRRQHSSFGHSSHEKAFSNGNAAEGPRIRVNGVRRPKGSSPSIAQLASSIVAEANLKRLGSSLTKLGSEAAVGVVDTKRLELAIAGSGARIKVPPLSANLCASVPVKIMDGNGAPLIEVLKSPPKAVSYPSRQYHQTLAAGSLSPTSVASSAFALVLSYLIITWFPAMGYPHWSIPLFDFTGSMRRLLCNNR